MAKKSNTKSGIIIVGVQGNGKNALEIFNTNQRTVLCFLDDKSEYLEQTIDNVTVLGKTDDENYLNLLKSADSEVFVAVDDVVVKKKYVKMLQETYSTMPINAIHAMAYVASTAQIGHGNLIDAGAVIQPFVSIGHHNSVGANVVIDSEASIDDFVQISNNVSIGKGVVIEEGVFIGAGAVIVAGVTIGKNARVGAGSIVISDVEPKKTVFGNPAAVINN